MKTIAKRFMSIVTIGILLIGCIRYPVAASTSVGISISGDAEVGKTITATISVSCDESTYGGYEGRISVDSQYLQVKSISASGYAANLFTTNGTSTFADGNCSIPSGSSIVKIELLCLAQGNGNIQVTVTPSTITDPPMDLESATGTKTVSVVNPVVRSSNTNLATLTVSPGTLSPAFSKNVTAYSLQVPETQTSVAVTATAEDAAASVSLNGVQNTIRPGNNVIKIVVTAEDGTTKTYKITVTCGTPTPTPEPYPLIEYDGQSYSILESETLETIPEGFVWGSTTYSGSLIPALVGPDDIIVLWLLSDDGTGLYFFDPVSGAINSMNTFTAPEQSFIFLPFPEGFSIPAGYVIESYDYQGTSVDVLRANIDGKESIIVYLLQTDGAKNLYYFDPITQLIFPYQGSLQILVAATPTPTLPTTTVAPTASALEITSVPIEETKPSNESDTIIILIIVGIVAFVLIVAILVLRPILSNVFSKYDETEEPEDDESKAKDTPVDPDIPEKESPTFSRDGDHYYSFGDEPQATAPQDDLNGFEDFGVGFEENAVSEENTSVIFGEAPVTPLKDAERIESEPVPTIEAQRPNALPNQEKPTLPADLPVNPIIEEPLDFPSFPTRPGSDLQNEKHNPSDKR